MQDGAPRMRGSPALPREDNDARIVLVAAVAATFGAGLSARAATCGSDTIDPSSVCEIGSTNNDFVSDPLQVTQDDLFG